MPSAARIGRRRILERYERLDLELKLSISRKLRDALRAEAIKAGVEQPHLVRRLLEEALRARRESAVEVPGACSASTPGRPGHLL
jgi:hypothetical protein